MLVELLLHTNNNKEKSSSLIIRQILKDPFEERNWCVVMDFALLKHSSGCLEVSKRQELVQQATLHHNIRIYIYFFRFLGKR